MLSIELIYDTYSEYKMNFQKFIEGRKEGERDGEGRKREKKNKRENWLKT